jgi:hypothetical protein
MSDYTNRLKHSFKAASGSSTVGMSIQWEPLLLEECKIWKNILIHEEINMILKKSEFDQLLERIDLLPPPSVPLTEKGEALIGFNNNQLENILKSFYSILFTLSLSSELEKLTNPILREEIRFEISKSISDSYAKVITLSLSFPC